MKQVLSGGRVRRAVFVLFWLGLASPFLSNRLAPVMDEVRAGTKTMLALVRTRISGIPGARVEFAAGLRPETGEAEISLDSSLTDLKKQGETDVILLELALPDLGPGIYTLAITAREEKSGASVEVRRTFRII